jgi:hypothetical protein
LRDLANLRLALSICVLTVKRFAESPLKRGVSDSEPRQHFTMNAFKPSFLKLKIGMLSDHDLFVFAHYEHPSSSSIECIVSASRLKPACVGFFPSLAGSRVKFYLPEPLARWAATVEKAANGHLPSLGRRSEVKKTRRFADGKLAVTKVFHLVV